MQHHVRGADLVVRTLEMAGTRTLFALSGNHIMPLFDALFDSGVELVHVRHEAAAVHMADAWGRLTGRCGVACVSGGAAFANAAAALCTAQAAESPLLLLSGHAPDRETGRGAFQELPPPEMAAPLTKATLIARSPESLGAVVAAAIRTAHSGRPGPVHVALPFDVLQAKVAHTPALWPSPAAFQATAQPLAEAAAHNITGALAAARRPLILAGPRLCHAGDLGALRTLEAATGVAVIAMESPRGLGDPRLGAFGEVLRQADLIVLLGKAHDFTLRYAEPPTVSADCRFIVIDAEPAMIARVAREKPGRVVFSAVADARSALEAIAARASIDRRSPGWLPNWHPDWLNDVRAAIAFRPASWTTAAGRPGKLHPVELCRALQSVIARSLGTILVCDGGEIGQWPQALLTPERRIVNGPAGAIGASIPFAIAARAADPAAPVIAVLGDGAFGFHMAEIDTAVRYELPFIAVIGNDASWNAEHQIQLGDYGPQRAHGCELLPSRYERVAEALGGHGAFVTAAADLAPAIERALASGKPACINVMVERVAAPSIDRRSV